MTNSESIENIEHRFSHIEEMIHDLRANAHRIEKNIEDRVEERVDDLEKRLRRRRIEVPNGRFYSESIENIEHRIQPHRGDDS